MTIRGGTMVHRMSGYRTMPAPLTCLRRIMGRFPRIIRFCAFTGLAVSLLAGCGGNPIGSTSPGPSPSASASASGSPGAELTTSPSVEGTGPESPQQAGHGGGGIAVPLAGLPIGKNAQYGQNDRCVEIIWKGAPPSRGTVVTVTKVVPGGPFTAHNLVPADCPHGSPCAGYRFTFDNIGDGRCYADLEYNGDPVTDPNGIEVDGTVELLGQLSCPGASLAACHDESTSLEGSGVTKVQFTALVMPAAQPGTGSSPPESPASPTGSPASPTESPASPTADAGSGSP